MWGPYCGVSNMCGCGCIDEKVVGDKMGLFAAECMVFIFELCGLSWEPETGVYGPAYTCHVLRRAGVIVRRVADTIRKQPDACI